MSIPLMLNLERLRKMKSKRTYSTETAARKIGVSFRTLNRWLAQEWIRPAQAIPIGGGRTIWRWTDADIVRGRRVKAAQKPGPKKKVRRK
jgi:hypothetical protein